MDKVIKERSGYRITQWDKSDSVRMEKKLYGGGWGFLAWFTPEEAISAFDQYVDLVLTKPGIIGTHSQIESKWYEIDKQLRFILQRGKCYYCSNPITWYSLPQAFCEDHSYEDNPGY